MRATATLAIVLGYLWQFANFGVLQQMQEWLLYLCFSI